jgi:hypothetical protein
MLRGKFEAMWETSEQIALRRGECGTENEDPLFVVLYELDV